MMTIRSILPVLVFSILAAGASLLAAGALHSVAAPAVTVSPARMLRGGIVTMKGVGFTPKASVGSHLRRPDGTEFNILPMMTNDRGEITHEIETFILDPGVYEVWIDDETAKKSTEHVKFEVTRSPAR
ncbi:MAG TPA: hypothetical protein VFY29_13455 [Terriglobia bacterium]|nr:hypothetical protein [Terriglobia bacterium]